MICKLCRITGRVQGVFYRAATQQQANRLNVTGYAKNCTDGSVEVLACGESDDVADLCEWLYQGPQYAKVEHVACADAEPVKTASFTTQ